MISPEKLNFPVKTLNNRYYKRLLLEYPDKSKIFHNFSYRNATITKLLSHDFFDRTYDIITLISK